MKSVPVVLSLLLTLNISNPIDRIMSYISPETRSSGMEMIDKAMGRDIQSK